MSKIQFEIDRAEVAKRGMQALPIVPNFNVFKDRCMCQRTSSKLTDHTFGFESAEKTFSNCIVISVPNPAHAHLDVLGRQTALIGSAGVLTTLVGMVQ